MENIQKQIKELSSSKGYDKETVEQKFLLLIEEAGELAKAARKEVGMQVGKHSKESFLAEEAADVLYVLIDLANKLEIDLNKALIEKVEIIKNRD